jgi:hypothetical protein
MMTNYAAAVFSCKMPSILKQPIYVLAFNIFGPTHHTFHPGIVGLASNFCIFRPQSRCSKSMRNTSILTADMDR